jgi:hypothetical protein
MFILPDSEVRYPEIECVDLEEHYQSDLLSLMNWFKVIHATFNNIFVISGGWCVDCPLVRWVVCGLSFGKQGGVWTVLWVGGWCVDCPLGSRVGPHTTLLPKGQSTHHPPD